jgi:hypothetical protein
MTLETTSGGAADDIAVSSFCFVRQLGPIRFESRNAQGELEVASLPLPRRHTLEEWAELVRDRLATTALELCQIQIDDPDPRRLRRLRDRLDELGMTVRTVPIDFGELDSSDAVRRAADVQHLLDWFDLAQTLDARYVRVNAGSPLADGGPADGSGLRDALRTLSDGARERGMQLLVENHGGPSSDPDVLLSLRADVDGLGILLDLGNFEPLVTVSRARFMGEHPPTDGLQVEDVYRRIGALAGAASLVHVKAFDPGSDGSPLLDVDRALGIVDAAGYAGPFTIEWEGQATDPWDATAGLLDKVRGLRSR